MPSFDLTLEPAFTPTLNLQGEGGTLVLELATILRGPPGLNADIRADIHAAPAKAAPDDADELGYLDSAGSWALVKASWAQLKAALRASFDSVYLAKAGGSLSGALALSFTGAEPPYGSSVTKFSVSAGGVTRFSVSDDGTNTLGGGRGGQFASVDSYGKLYGSELKIGSVLNLNPSGAILSSSAALSWSSDGNYYGANDVFLRRDAAGVLALRNGSSGQALRIYNTYTDASNYERGFMRWASNVLEIGAEAGGTGTLRGVAIRNTVRIGSDTSYLDLDPTNRSITGFLGGSYGATFNFTAQGFSIVDTGVTGNKVFEASLSQGFFANKVTSGGGIAGLTCSPLNVYCTHFPANAVTPAFTVGAYTTSGGAINDRIKLFNGDAGKLILNSNSTGAVEVASGLFAVSGVAGSSSDAFGATLSIITDTSNPTVASLGLMPSKVSRRLHIGTPANYWYSLSLAGVSGIESMPPFSIGDAMTIGGGYVAGSGSSFQLTRTGANAYLKATGPTAKFIINVGSTTFAVGYETWHFSENLLEQRNGTNPQTFRLYNTYTDASNYERGFMRWASNVLEIGTEYAGTGTYRQTKISAGGAVITLDAGSWSTSIPGNMVFPQFCLGNVTGGVSLLNYSATTGAFLQFTEQTAPAAPATNSVRIYAEDNGAGKTRLMALFSTGAAVQIAIEP